MDETLEHKLGRLFADAEAAEVEGMCVLDSGQYGKVQDGKLCCCALGAAGLKAGLEAKKLLDGGDRHVMPVLSAKYQLNTDALTGIIDGFDGDIDNSYRLLSTKKTYEYQTASRLAREFAVRKGISTQGAPNGD